MISSGYTALLPIMPVVEKYRDRGPVDVSGSFSTEELVGKSVVITGGANGLGKAYVQAFVDAGAFVTIGDIDETLGKEAASALPGKVQFVKCDVRKWEEQVSLFEAASKFSLHGGCDIVIANAGIVGEDDLFRLDGKISCSLNEDHDLTANDFIDPNKPPIKPDLSILDVDLIGMLYTTKLAFHYFRRQPVERYRDRCLILISSIAAYVDQPGTPQYNVAKWGTRALMRNLRRTAWKESIRINLVAPW
ncbi:hypothetical protein HYALB_00011574 [Hymenoscyphus albidus]|uniref:NAD(P)-binding protein n=1 Tax=Hymenoscyphus albidus TaxID=595503 RepID=A0A9N9Q555_9HELO|nr:hypothetical protein HYALB_00011574 [Hymenoscyphus albidus]